MINSKLGKSLATGFGLAALLALGGCGDSGREAARLLRPVTTEISLGFQSLPAGASDCAMAMSTAAPRSSPSCIAACTPSCDVPETSMSA